MDTALSPGFARITYTGVTGIHHSMIPVNLQTGWVAGTEPNLIKKDATPDLAGTLISDYVDVWRGLLLTSQNIGLCEVYAVNSVTGEGTFVWGFDLARAGALVGTAAPYRLMLMTWKLTNGRTGRTYILENSYAVDGVAYPPYGVGSPEEDLAAYLCGDDSIFYGRGNAYPFAPISYHTKTFDPLRSRAGL